MKSIMFLSAALLLSGCASDVKKYEHQIQSNDLFDQDRDGVINARDKCADTPIEVITNNDGCPSEKEVATFRNIVIEFGYDKSTLTDAAKLKISNFAKSVVDLPNITILLIGDTSTEGSLQYNRKLALKRVESVKTALLAHNVKNIEIKEQTFINSKNIPKSLAGRKTRVIALVSGETSVELERQFDVYNTGN
ncbi:OmpA family protein [Pseudoalteromonas sp. SWXJZ94C]|uniref:OmpA family protein n=1 Tax=unclassified Pseudoalteromonas TaxID=194690 RepID=UPI000415BB28|nr:MULTISPECIES: OmpA family protein [unclassified Pseudoalteromonas]MBH0057807.1 OmpA family protein [Pseudoalteromonas sp. SWXJZ94C]